MGKRYKIGIFIFRRDLRLYDNSALISAGELCEKVIPCFILDPRQLEKNPYRGESAVQFMIESIMALKREIDNSGGKLYIFYGYPHEVISQLIEYVNIDSIFVNKDYTPFSKNRDYLIKIKAEEKGVTFHSEEDVLLSSPNLILKEDGSPIVVFSRFYKKAINSESVPKPRELMQIKWFDENLKLEISEDKLNEVIKKYNKSIVLNGGRESGLKVLKKAYNLTNYASEHDMLDVCGTTMLSPYLKFGCLSVREVYWGLNINHPNPTPIIRQLYWRDFFTLIANYYPEVFGQEFNKSYRGMWWSHDENLFVKWTEGLTGFPVVDAGIRELIHTGWMHNRARLIIASFLTKDLHIDWRWGEKFFAQNLVDYDPSVNNGNWQWCAGTGCDAQPYFRIFNPWLQAKKFDPEARYIKKWIPELKDLTPSEIHNWDKLSESMHSTCKYPKPCVNHYEEAEKAKILFRQYIHKNI